MLLFLSQPYCMLSFLSIFRYMQPNNSITHGEQCQYRNECFPHWCCTVAGQFKFGQAFHGINCTVKHKQAKGILYKGNQGDSVYIYTLSPWLPLYRIPLACLCLTVQLMPWNAWPNLNWPATVQHQCGKHSFRYWHCSPCVIELFGCMYLKIDKKDSMQYGWLKNKSIWK